MLQQPQGYFDIFKFLYAKINVNNDFHLKKSSKNGVRIDFFMDSKLVSWGRLLAMTGCIGHEETSFGCTPIVPSDYPHFPAPQPRHLSYFMADELNRSTVLSVFCCRVCPVIRLLLSAFASAAPKSLSAPGHWAGPSKFGIWKPPRSFERSRGTKPTLGPSIFIPTVTLFAQGLWTLT